jgi:HAD superfamily hydrolase (TIGR01509 family)
MSHFDAVIFDMDGTLIEPLLDFSRIRRELDVPDGSDILKALAALPADEAKRRHDLLVKREMDAANRAKLMPGAAEALRTIREAGLKTALLTRNMLPAMRQVLQRFPALQFELAWSREDGPIKPEPDGILRACRKLDVTPDRTAAVGDFHYDIAAANAAGATAVLLAPGSPPPWAAEAPHVIQSLTELPSILGIRQAR